MIRITEHGGPYVGGVKDATKVPLMDAGNYYASTDVEAALAEVGHVLNGTRENLVASANSLLGM